MSEDAGRALSVTPRSSTAQGWGPSTAGEPGSRALWPPSPCEAGAAGQTDLVAASRRSESRWPFLGVWLEGGCVRVKSGAAGARHWHVGWSPPSHQGRPAHPFPAKVAPSQWAFFTCPLGTSRSPRRQVTCHVGFAWRRVAPAPLAQGQGGTREPGHATLQGQAVSSCSVGACPAQGCALPRGVPGQPSVPVEEEQVLWPWPHGRVTATSSGLSQRH